MRKLATAMVLVLAALGWGCRNTGSHPMNERAKYGDLGSDTVWERSSPEARGALAEHSREAAELGWRHLRSGDASTAMRRFNQAWTLDPRNAQALWGMAVIIFDRAKAVVDRGEAGEVAAALDEAIELIDEAVHLEPEEAPLLADAALLVATRGGFRRAAGAPTAEADFARAEALLQRAAAIAHHPQIDVVGAALRAQRGDDGSR